MKRSEEKMCDESCKRSKLELLLSYLFKGDKIVGRILAAGLASGIVIWSLKLCADDIIKITNVFIK